jgi:hypothetical protein
VERLDAALRRGFTHAPIVCFQFHNALDA